MTVSMIPAMSNDLVSAATANSTTTPRTGKPTTSETATNTTQPAKTVPSSLNHDRRVVAASADAVIIQVGIAQKSGSQADINQLAVLAQQAHDTLTSEKDSIAVDGDTSNQNDTNLYDACDGLKNSMGALVAYTGNPNPATLASFTTQYQPAVSEWNQAASALYAGTGTAPPTIG
jgi:hypothetical protein